MGCRFFTTEDAVDQFNRKLRKINTRVRTSDAAM